MAEEYNAEVIILEGAPRVKTVEGNLRRARDAAKALGDALAGLDDYSRGWLEIPAPMLEYRKGPYDSPYLRGYETARGMHLPTPERERPASDGNIVEQMRALESYINEGLTRFVKKHARDNKGGNTNLILKETGAPAYNFVLDGWSYFENHRPGEATASENGPLLQFLNCVYEFATGEVDENSTIHNWAKKIARPKRRERELWEEGDRLQAEQDELYSKPPTPESRARVAAIQDRIRVVGKALPEAIAELSHRKLARRSRKQTS